MLGLVAKASQFILSSPPPYTDALTPKSHPVKRGSAKYLFLEAEATRYAAARCPSIPIPSVHDFWVESDGSARLIMDYVEGERLQSGWKRITEAQKLTLMRILRKYIEEMRSVSQPNGAGWIGSVSGGSCFDYCAYGDELYLRAISERHAPTAARLQELRAEMPDSHRITFTHGDLTDPNILIRVPGEGPDDVTVAAVVDWEQAGWRPEYRETAKFHYNSRTGWRDSARQMVFPDYLAKIKRETELLSIQRAPR
ncbi:kinase-like domain-containing protein [Mycena vitilis]|nr:kinase-like domain-containing protein [Mycena vitilis]